MGYIIFWIVEETMEIHNIAVKGEFKRRGLGSRLMDFLLETASEEKVAEIFLEVRKSNAEAIKFYKKYNFKQVDCRKKYFNNPREDALVFALYLQV